MVLIRGAGLARQLPRPRTQTAPDEKSEAEQDPSLGEKPQGGVVTPGAPGRIRTCDTRFRRAVLYPLSYGGGHLYKNVSKTAQCAELFLDMFWTGW